MIKKAIIILIVCQLYNFSYAQEIEAGKFNLAEEYFPNAQILEELTCDGRLSDCDIAENSGHIVMATIFKHAAKVTLLSPEGEKLWEIDNSILGNYQPIQVEIDANGSIIMITWGGNEEEIIQFYDLNKNLLLQKEEEMGATLVYQLSPHGRYAVTGNEIFFFQEKRPSIIIPGYENGWGYTYHIFTENFIVVTVSKEEKDSLSIKNRLKDRTIRERRKVLPMKFYLFIYNIDNGSIVKKFDFWPGAYTLTFTNNKNILLQIAKSIPDNLTDHQFNLICFNDKGNELWSKENFIRTYHLDVFFGDENILVHANNELMILKKESGDLLSNYKFPRDERFTALKTFTLIKNRIYLCGQPPMGAGLLGTAIYELTETGVITKEYLEKGFIIAKSLNAPIVGGDNYTTKNLRIKIIQTKVVK